MVEENRQRRYVKRCKARLKVVTQRCVYPLSPPAKPGGALFFSQYHETNVNKYNAFNAMQLSSLVELESLGPGPRAWARSLRARRWAWGKPLNWASGYSVGPGFGSSAGACAWASVCLGRSLCVGRRARPRAVGQGEESGVGVRARPGTEPTGPYPVVTGTRGREGVRRCKA